jgi:hypothetical protein
MADGNDVQSRIVATQLFDAWKAEQELDAKATRRWLGGNVAGWIAAVAVVVTAIAAGGRTYNLASDAYARTIQNENTIATMKADNGDRLARIETKIDLMMEERKR